MAHTVIGVYDNYKQAQQALDELTKSGFSIEHVNLSPGLETEEARQAALRHDEKGGGGVRGFFRSMFGAQEQDQHADIYSEAVRRGSYLLTVHAQTDEQADRATEILNRYNPVDINERAAHWQSQGWSQYETSAPVLSEKEIQQERSRYAGNKTAIPVIQEELQVGKRVVQRGGVRIFQHVVETPVEESVQLREEHVSVERHPLNEPATEADMATLKEGSFEVRESAEEAVVAKTARVVEEVVVGKDVSERTETISDTVRRTDVEVEQMTGNGQGTATAFDDTDFRNHWQTTYGKGGGRYEDYSLAYRFGSRMASDERYSKYRWNDVEPEVRRDWESSNASHPWERVKDAVRYGWEKVSK